MKLGPFGENLAKEHLESLGYRLLHKNFRYERAEIDLIFIDDTTKTVIFTEVKTRKSKEFGEPEDSVFARKQEQLIKSAHGFMMNNEQYEDFDKRFDIVTVFLNGSKPEINHIIDAF